METVKKTKLRRKYDADFKAQVLKMVANGQPVSQIAQSLSIGEALIYRWKNEQKHQSLPLTSNPDLLLQNEQLKAKLKQSELEKDILKKALAIFSQSRPS
jgi:transposase